MRTTVDIDEHLLQRVKKKAAAAQCTLSEVVEHALRLHLQPVAANAAPFEIVTYGRRGDPFPDLVQLADDFEKDEIDHMRRGGR